MIGEFKEFLAKTTALALAIGVIIGAAVSGVVSAVVSDLMMPVIGLLLPGGGWRDAKFVLRPADEAKKVTENAILYGHFLGTLIDFLIIMLVVFLLLRVLMRALPPPPPAATKPCPECLETIPAAARRCRACTAVVA